MPETLRPGPKLASIALLTCDVDGVLTDGGMYFGPSGLELLRFNVLDGLGLKALQSAGVHTAFVTQSNNPIIAARARALGVAHCLMGIENKLPAVEELAINLGLSLAQVCHIADDVNDLSLLRSAGVAVTVPGGADLVQAVAHFVTCRPGGGGAVRELCDAILQSKGRAVA